MQERETEDNQQQEAMQTIENLKGNEIAHETEVSTKI